MNWLENGETVKDFILFTAALTFALTVAMTVAGLIVAFVMTMKFA